ncbi:MAG: amino acid ABC transporter permease [Clostridia bacterium]|nr:amino acid ABC transporter permease [Clostridia bacterium]
MLDIIKVLFGGFGENLRIFALTLLMAIPLGLVITFGSMTKFRPLRWLTRVFVWVIRGTPLMLQLFVVLYAPGLLFGVPMRNRMMATLVAFVINYAAYFSEIYRGGIESIPKGQYEAGQVLGMTRGQIFFKVVLLQVIKRITPSMGNEVITLAKDSALARVIGVAEIIMVAERYTKQGLIGPLFSTGLYFLLFNGLLTLLLGWIERRMDYFRA